MNWQTLTGFITERDPVFAAALQGVPPDEIRRVEQENGVRLPAAYRQFLEMMGRDSDGFFLFGRGQTHSFDDLVEDLPAESYPSQKYFRIAFPNDNAEISAPDYFLDLGRSDGEDAPIVMFEELPFFKPESVKERRFTFVEWAARQLFTFLVIGRAAARAMVVLGFLNRDEGLSEKDEVVAMFAKMKFEPVLPPLERVVCLRRNDDGALIDVLMDGRGISITLCGNDRRTLEIVVDQLLVRYPGAAVSDPDAPSSL